MTKQSIKDDGREHKYFHILPNMADDDLDPYQYRLYGHYKRKCGDNGTCEDSVRQTAKATQMSDKKVQSARDQLAEMGYIKVEKPTAQQARKGQTVHITLLDMWQQNVYRYAKAVVNLPQVEEKPVVDIPQPVVNMPQEAVVNLPRSTYKELKREDSLKNKKKKRINTLSKKKKPALPAKPNGEESGMPAAPDEPPILSLDELAANAAWIEEQLEQVRKLKCSSRQKVKRNDIPRTA